MDRNRKAAFDILLSVEKGAYSNIASNKIITQSRPDDPRFVRELVHGVLSGEIFLDHVLDQLIPSGIKKVKAREKILLRLGLFQIIKAEKIPDYAAVGQTTEMAKKLCRGRDGFVNGVLRGYLKKRDQMVFPGREEDLREFLRVNYSFPLWIIDLWTEQFGADVCEDMLKASNCRPDLSIRINRLKTDRNSLTRELEKEGIEVRPGNLSPRALILLSGKGVFTTSAYKNGKFSVQDEASIFAADTIGVLPGENVIDMCAAPGGKAAAMAEMMENRGTLTACDIFDHKLELIKDQAQRLGIENIKVRLADGRNGDPSMAESADRVLVDAPCSGLGVIRRRPEIRYRSAEGISAIIQIQKMILQNASSYVKKGGTLMYSTCTVNDGENRRQIEAFTEKNSNFEIIYQKQFLPTQDVDGFYICKMLKKG